MPGITAVRPPIDRESVDDSLRAVRFDRRYRRHDLFDGDETFIGYTGYETYPVRTFEMDGCTVVLEGYLYGTDAVESAVSSAAEYVLDGSHERLRRWIAERDGDFLLLVADHAEDELWALNDAFGRLPTYRATFGETTVLTRELKAIREMAVRRGEGLETDRLALSQILLFRYPLGTRTLFEGVEQLPPGSLLEVGTGDVTSLYEFRCDRCSNERSGIDANARLLKDRFLRACSNRASVVDETVVALSGGLDSRAVLAGYDHLEGRVSAATSGNRVGTETREVAVAQRVAKTLGKEWYFYTVDRQDRHLNDLLDYTQGMNNVENANGLHFAELVGRDHAHHTAMVVTGDGGDKVMPDLTLTQEVETPSDLVDVIIDGQKCFTLDRVTDLTGVDAGEIRASVRERVESYPEASSSTKHAHFLVRERGINWLNHGEDRTRYHIWSTTPFYALPFFTEAMACSSEQKRATELYRRFLSELSPSVVRIDYADFGAPITSLEYRAKRYLYDWLCEHPGVKDCFFDLLRLDGGGAAVDGHAARAIDTANRTASGYERVLSSEAVHRISRNAGTYSDEQLYLLLTALCTVAETGIEIQPGGSTMRASYEGRSTPLNPAMRSD